MNTSRIPAPPAPGPGRWQTLIKEFSSDEADSAQVLCRWRQGKQGKGEGGQAAPWLYLASICLVISTCMLGCHSEKGDQSGSKDTVEQVVIQKLSNQTQVHESELHRGIRLKEDLMMDDLDWVELTMELEDHFGISIPDEEAERWHTIADISTTVKKKLASGPGGSPQSSK